MTKVRTRSNEASASVPVSKQTKIQFKYNGVDLGTKGTVDTLDFTGASVSVTRVGDVVTVTITGGGGGGSGDVVGPASAANNNIALFDGATGKLIKDGGGTIADVIASAVAAGVTPLSITAIKLNVTYAAAANEFVPFDTTLGNGVLILPTAPPDGTRVGTRLTVQGSAVRTLTINRGGSDIIENGATSRTVGSLGTTIVYQYVSSVSTWRAIVDGNSYNSLVKALSDIITPIADQFPYFTSSSAAALTPLSLFIRGLLDDPDALTARDTLGVMQRVVLTGSNVVNNNATPDTMQDVTGLQFPVVAGTYFFMFTIKYTSAASSTGSGWGISGPTLVSLGMYTLNTLTASTGSMRTESAYDGHTVNATSIMGTNNTALMWGIITVSASGNVTARFSSEVAGSAITVLGGSESMVQYLKIA